MIEMCLGLPYPMRTDLPAGNAVHGNHLDVEGNASVGRSSESIFDESIDRGCDVSSNLEAVAVELLPKLRSRRAPFRDRVKVVPSPDLTTPRYASSMRSQAQLK